MNNVSCTLDIGLFICPLADIIVFPSVGGVAVIVFFFLLVYVLMKRRRRRLEHGKAYGVIHKPFSQHNARLFTLMNTCLEY